MLTLSRSQHAAALVLWDYQQLGHVLRRCPVAVGLGCRDIKVAETAARLYHRGLAPLIVFTGGLCAPSAQAFPEGEAVGFAQRALELGVPREALLEERRAQNTGENIEFTRELLEARGLSLDSAIFVTMPYMQRRAWATVQRVWPQIDVLCASEPISFDDYVGASPDPRRVVESLVGNTQRIILYPRLGFTVPQKVPPLVYRALDTLIDAGFVAKLIEL